MVFRSRVTGNVLPNARRVSVAIHSEAEGPETDPNVQQLPNMSIVAMTFAQFLDHDLTLTPGRLRTKAFRHIEHNTHGAVKTTEWPQQNWPTVVWPWSHTQSVGHVGPIGHKFPFLLPKLPETRHCTTLHWHTALCTHSNGALAQCLYT